MEILSYVKELPPIIILPVICLSISIIGIVGAICWAIEEGWEPYIIATLAISAITFIGCIIWICNIHEDVFIFARMTDEKSFTEMIKNYDFIEEVAGIYKLRLK